MSTCRKSLWGAGFHDFALVVLSTKGGSVALRHCALIACELAKCQRLESKSRISAETYHCSTSTLPT